MRPVTSPSTPVVGRFAATLTDLCATAFEAGRDTVLRGFLDMSQVPDGAALSGLEGAGKPAQLRGGPALQLGTRQLYSARICPEPDLFGRTPVHSRLTRILRCSSPPRTPRQRAPAIPTAC